jgi:hypothetical protein
MSHVPKLLAAAKAGDLDELFELVSAAADEGQCDPDETAYKWLHVALDVGHQEAEERLEDLECGSSLRFDDGQMLVGLIHLELGEAYLRGSDGLPIDDALARQHLTFAASVKVHETTDVAQGFPELRRTLSDSARAVFDACFPLDESTGELIEE